MSDDYSGLRGLVDKVVEEAIYAELRVYGWYPDDQGGVTFIAGGLGGGYSVSAARPGNGYPSDPVSPNAGYVDPEGGYTDGSPTLGDVYRKWESKIPPVFEPFFGLDDQHTRLQGLADSAKVALEQLATEGRSGGSGPEEIDYAGNSTLAQASTVAQILATWQGSAAASFQSYLNVFREVVGNQAQAVDALRAVLYMEQEMFVRLRDDVVMLAKNAAAAFSNCGSWSGDDIKAVLSVAGTVNSILGWFPALKPVTEPTGKGLVLAGLVVDTFGGEEPENPLGDFQFTDVFHKVEGAAEDLLKASRTVEGDIQQALVKLKEVIETAPPARSDGTTDQASFRLPRPEQTYSATSTDDFVTAQAQLFIEPDRVRDAAQILDNELSAEMTTAASSLDAADSSGAWYRNPEIGLGASGAYGEYSSASYVLEKEIEETAKEMKWAAEMLRAVEADLRNTDDDVRDDFGGVRRKIDQYDNPVYEPVPRNPSKPLPPGPY